MLYKKAFSLALTLALLASIVPSIDAGCRSCRVKRSPRRSAPARPAPVKPAPAPKKAPAKSVAKEDLVQAAIENNGTFLAFFTKPNCGFCESVKPIITEVAREENDNTAVIEVNIGGNEDYYAQQYNITEVPTFIYFKDGKEAYRHDSKNKTITKEEITQNIEEYLETETGTLLSWAKIVVPVIAVALVLFGYEKYKKSTQEAN